MLITPFDKDTAMPSVRIKNGMDSPAVFERLAESKYKTSKFRDNNQMYHRYNLILNRIKLSEL